MNKEWKHPFWENYQKDRITAKLTIKHGDGKESTSTATVSKYTRDGKLTEDYEAIIAQNGVEKIDRNTKEREDRHTGRGPTTINESAKSVIKHTNLSIYSMPS